MNNLRQRLRQWMVDSMAERGWSAERWGRESGTAATNITRFLKSDKAAIPNSRTLERLANAIGIPAPVGGMKKFAVNSIPILDPTTVKMVHWPATSQDIKSLMMQNAGNILAPHEVSSEAFAVEAPSDRLSAIGIAIGDMLVIEPNAEQAAGAKMLYRIGDRIDIGVLEDGMLSPRCFKAEPTVRIEEVELVGRIVSVVKRM